MKTKTTKQLIGISLLLVFGLMTTLGIHLYFVKKHKANQMVYAMGRIDFKEEISPESSMAIQEFTSQLNGVQNALVNPKQKVLVFIYQPKLQSAIEINEKVQFFTQLNSQVYQSTAEALESGCPVGISETSFSKKLVSLVTSPILFD
ncbi:MAG: hypothetical protein K9H61_12565 [Bacteroidia bacterium]|nr:hypothetical protein [Bacteroidia bacterium]MCF8426681.1 hypothetical protein [Bacteroidia bacterium]MCF8447818.1 hypothetical protein [Bacteroidia bacterium]